MRRLIRIFILSIAVIILLCVLVKLGKAWVGDSSEPHVYQGSQYIQHSYFNRFVK